MTPTVWRRMRATGGLVVTTTILWALTATHAWAEDPVGKPDPTRAKNAPGVDGLASLADALTLYVLIGCLLGGLISAFAAAFGGAISERLRDTGKIGLIACIAIAFVTGILWAVINWAYGAGS